MKVHPEVQRPLVGVIAVAVVGAVVATALLIFSGGFSAGVPVTVVSPRAGLVMNPDANVKMRGVDVGRVSSIDTRPDGTTLIHLQMNPSQLKLIPANVKVDIASTTVFGAKFIQLTPPAEPSGQAMHAGQVLSAENVTVEINTIFQRLTAILTQLDPAKLNATLAAISRGLSGRGEKFGQTLSDLDALLKKLEPGLPALSTDLSTAPGVLNVYADTAGDLLKVADNTSQISQSVVDEQNNLDALLVNAIGLADVGNQFLADNRAPLANLIHLLVPTLELTDQYNSALNCSLVGLADLQGTVTVDSAGLGLSASFLWGHERYRYPGDLPKIAAKGGPHCEFLPVYFEERPKYLLTDIGTNPNKYGNQGLLINSDGLKQLLYGPIDGPPRNTSQIGQVG
jgi:virulence factor Mce-like protein